MECKYEGFYIMRFLIICCLFAVATTPVFAQNQPRPPFSPQTMQDTEDGEPPKFTARQLKKWERSMNRFTDLYDSSLDVVLENETPRNLRNNVRRLRAYYSHSEYYTPFADNLLDRITGFAYTVDTSEDRSEVLEALKKYRELVHTHLPNYDVLKFAHTMSRLNPQFGNASFYREVLSIIQTDLKDRPSPCTVPNMACPIVSYGEETYLLKVYTSKVYKSEIYNVGHKYFNVHDAVDKQGNSIQLYMDVTSPIYNIQKMKALKQKEENINIPRR